MVGDETSVSVMTLAEESFTERVTAIGASFADEASGYCLMAISFTLVSFLVILKFSIEMKLHSDNLYQLEKSDKTSGLPIGDK